MIKPTVGRIVWFHPGTEDDINTNNGQPLAAVVAAVYSDSLVCLTVFGANGIPQSRDQVPLVQDGSAVSAPVAPGTRWAEWPQLSA